MCLGTCLSTKQACFQLTSRSRLKTKYWKYLCSKLRAMASANRKGGATFPRSQLAGTHGELTMRWWCWASPVHEANKTPVLERLKNDVPFFREPGLLQSHQNHRLTRTKNWPIYKQCHKRVLAYQPSKGRNCQQETSQPQPYPTPPFLSAWCYG